MTLILNRFDIPIYLDTAGTMLISMLAGSFPGILTAVATNLICTVFDGNAIYFGFVNTLIAIFTAWYVKERGFKTVRNIVIYVFSAALMSGIFSTLIQLSMGSETENPSVAALVGSIGGDGSFRRILYLMGVNILLDIVGKTISIAFALIIHHFIPQNTKNRIRVGGWKQKPMSYEEIKETERWSKGTKHSIRTRMTVILVLMLLTTTSVVAWTGMKLYYDNIKAERIGLVQNTAKFAADVVAGDMVYKYLKEGSDARGYRETEDMLKMIRDNAPGVEYLYVLKIEKDYSTFIFDLDAKEEYIRKSENLYAKAYRPGQKVQTGKELEPYMDRLLAGEMIEPVESEKGWNWIVSSYYPVFDKSGNCVCYAGADTSLVTVADYIRTFGVRIFLAMSGILILVLSFGIWQTSYFLIFPIESIGKCVDEFTRAGTDQTKLDESLKKMRSLDISTEDEVEKLYHAVCDTSLNETEQIRSISRYSENTSRMQDGLIMTMADMVENRDSDTGAHVQKTAAYVKIIVEGLKKKGYYAEKITPKFMSDVVRSAPLHDIGKINIPDNVLNKPGKLDDAEYAIMKTHTVAGKDILEKAIDTVGGENYLKEARNMAAYHHERWDGKGYPVGLHGEVIPLSARIMAVADVFDALTSPRVYKPAFSLKKAVDIIEEGSGTQFDPKCVEVFFEALDDVKIILRKYNKTVGEDL